MDAITQNNVVVTPLFIRILLNSYLSYIQSWARLHSTIVAANISKEYKTPLDWLRFMLV